MTWRLCLQRFNILLLPIFFFPMYLHFEDLVLFLGSLVRNVSGVVFEFWLRVWYSCLGYSTKFWEFWFLKLGFGKLDVIMKIKCFYGIFVGFSLHLSFLELGLEVFGFVNWLNWGFVGGVIGCGLGCDCMWFRELLLKMNIELKLSGSFAFGFTTFDFDVLMLFFGMNFWISQHA